MGNCMEKSAPRKVITQKVKEPEKRLEEEEQQEEEEEEEEEEGCGSNPAKEGGFKVKILLTRGELEWLVMQLKKGEKRLEDVLKEMNKDKSKAMGWKPSLKSIVEGSELQNFD